MGIFKQFATNKAAEREGVPSTFEPNADGSVPTLYIKRVRRNSVTYQAAFERHTRPFKGRLDKLTAAEDQEIMQRVFIDVGMAGWDNIRLPKGVAELGLGDDTVPYEVYATPMAENPEWRPVSRDDYMKANADAFNIPYSPENAFTIFQLLPDMWLEAAERAVDGDTFKVGDLEALAKN